MPAKTGVFKTGILMTGTGQGPADPTIVTPPRIIAFPRSGR